MKEVGRCAGCNKHTILWSGMGNDIVCRECFEKKVIV